MPEKQVAHPGQELHRADQQSHMVKLDKDKTDSILKDFTDK